MVKQVSFQKCLTDVLKAFFVSNCFTASDEWLQLRNDWIVEVFFKVMANY